MNTFIKAVLFILVAMVFSGCGSTTSGSRYSTLDNAAEAIAFKNDYLTTFNEVVISDNILALVNDPYHGFLDSNDTTRNSSTYLCSDEGSYTIDEVYQNHVMNLHVSYTNCIDQGNSIEGYQTLSFSEDSTIVDLDIKQFNFDESTEYVVSIHGSIDHGFMEIQGEFGINDRISDYLLVGDVYQDHISYKNESYLGTASIKSVNLDGTLVF